MSPQTGSPRRSNGSCSSRWPQPRSRHDVRSPPASTQIEQAQRQSAQHAQALKAQIDAERQLAAAHLQPVFDPGWWETAATARRRGHVAGGQQLAGPRPGRGHADDLRSRRRPDPPGGARSHRPGPHPGTWPSPPCRSSSTSTRRRSRRNPVRQPAELEATDRRDLATPRGFDDPQRREQLRTRLVAAGVPEPAIEARTLADLGQAREAAEAAQTPVAAAPGPRPAAARSANRELRRWR